jgi:hypothetical protein
VLKVLREPKELIQGLKDYKELKGRLVVKEPKEPTQELKELKEPKVI